MDNSDNKAQDGLTRWIKWKQLEAGKAWAWKRQCEMETHKNKVQDTCV